MSSNDLNGIYPMVLPKPNADFEHRYYEILDTGWYELDKETKDATELFDHSSLPIEVIDIPKIGIDEMANDWAEDIYFNLLSEKRCVHDDEYWEIVKRLPDFYAAAGSKQLMKEYLLGINLTTFLELMEGMPVFRLKNPNPAIPNYNSKGKGYHPENSSDWLNFDKEILLKCITSFSGNTKSILSKKYLKPTEIQQLIDAINKDIETLKIKLAGNEPNGHLIIKYDVENRSFLYDGLVVHVLEDFGNWLMYWKSMNYPIGLNCRFLIGR